MLLAPPKSLSAAQFSAEQLLSPEQIRRMDSEVPCLGSESYLGRFGHIRIYLGILLVGHAVNGTPAVQVALRNADQTRHGLEV
jgi:uncharacterized Zn-finger protein